MTKRNEGEVGYKKPPKQHRFQKGQSGNTQGRPKGAVNLVTALQRAMQEKVQITENGRYKTISKAAAAAKQLVNKAAGGDARSVKLLLDLMPQLDDQAAAHAAAALPLSEPDQEVMAEMVRRIRSAYVASNDGAPQTKPRSGAQS